MSHVNLSAAICALILLGACKEEHGTPLLGNACVPKDAPTGVSSRAILTSAEECGGDPCIVGPPADTRDAGSAADRTLLCSERDPIRGCLDARQVEPSGYCTCRCAGPDRNCLCPNDYACQELAAGPGQVGGSYCVRRADQ